LSRPVFVAFIPARQYTSHSFIRAVVVKKSAAKSRCGLLAAGNWIIDQVKVIDVYPQRDQLANIRGQFRGTGGSPYNVSVTLARLQAPFPLAAAGLVGSSWTIAAAMASIPGICAPLPWPPLHSPM
jgi:hypothetical protein